VAAESYDSSLEKNTESFIGRFFAVIGNLLFVLMLLLIVSILFFLVQNKIAGGQPKFFGRYMYIVVSGSMSPTFDTGSVVFVKPAQPEEVRQGDVITFRGLEDPQALTTHRVVEVIEAEEGIQFITKGDDNKVSDPSPVSGDRLVGTLSFSIPYLGYLMSFGQTKQGVLLLVVIPGTFLILTELHKLYLNTKLGKKEEKDDPIL